MVAFFGAELVRRVIALQLVLVVGFDPGKGRGNSRIHVRIYEVIQNQGAYFVDSNTSELRPGYCLGRGLGCKPVQPASFDPFLNPQ